MGENMEITRQKKRIDDIFNDIIKYFFDFAKMCVADMNPVERDIVYYEVEEFRECVSSLFAALKTRYYIEDIPAFSISIGNGSVEYISLSFCGENSAKLFRIENETYNNSFVDFELTDYIRGKKVKGEIEEIIQYIIDETD